MNRKVTDGLQPLRDLPGKLEQLPALDSAAGALARTVERAAPAGSIVNDALSGTPIGHPLHPPLTDVAIGAWTAAIAMDWLGGKRHGRAADWLIAFGGLSVLPTAAAGFNDWATLDTRSRRLGLVHGLTNIFATGLFGASWLARKSDRRSAGRLLALAGYGTVSLGAFLGGHLSFGSGVGVDHTAFLEVPEDWTVVADESSLMGSEPILVNGGGVEIMLVRQEGSIHALLDRCAHQGAPLHKGSIERGCVVCPWHSSRYRLEDGVALGGPTSHAQPVLQVRVREGRVEVRHPVTRS
jgi:nitrite reductase/ring-hydroxylating ferredoxin subunit/uncharacterized membrane protein